MSDLFQEGNARRQPPSRIWPPRLAAYLSRLEEMVWRIAVAVQNRTDQGRDALETQKGRIDSIATWRQNTVNPALNQTANKFATLDASNAEIVNRLDGHDASLLSLSDKDAELEARIAALENPTP